MNLPLSLEELILNFLGLPIRDTVSRKPSSRRRGCSLCLGREFRVLIVKNNGYECFNLDTIARVMHLFGKPVIYNERPLLKKAWRSVWHRSEQDEYALLWRTQSARTQSAQTQSEQTQSEEAFVYPEPDRSPEEILLSWLNEPMPDIALYTCLRDSRHTDTVRTDTFQEEDKLPVGNYLLDDIYHLPDYGYYRILHSAVIPSMTRLELLYDPLRLFGGIPLSEWMDPALNPISYETNIVKIIALPNHKIVGNHPKRSYTCYCADYIAVATTLLGYTDLKANELAVLIGLWLAALSYPDRTSPTCTSTDLIVSHSRSQDRPVSPILSSVLRLGLPIPSIADGYTPVGIHDS
jgi:hypothetical protein